MQKQVIYFDLAVNNYYLENLLFDFGFRTFWNAGKPSKLYGHTQIGIF